ncbi:MAG: DUF1549 domain-containing protein, partial [Planctomycetales bacterium]|nr:DUF1549 domain-containing protein [Planctomycetales bacterium]
MNLPATLRRLRCFTAVVLGLAVVFASVVCAGAEADDRFESQIAPLLVKRCLSCHAAEDPHGKFDLSRQAGALAGGESGEPAIVPGKPLASNLLDRVRSGEMPPKGKGQPLTRAEIALLESWIADGAPWPDDRTLSPFEFTSERRGGYDWWSLRPLAAPAAPHVKDSQWPRSDIDRFVLARLEDAGLSPSPQADRATLIRRLTFDLLGLPPTPEEVQAFVADPDAAAYERLIDRLLASPHYGERWARHWLDVARFGESDGFEYDRPRENAWPYRDWVIQALNDD